MARTRAFKTSLALNLADGEEHEVSIVLRYQFTPGYPDSWEEPGHPDGVEIIGATVSGCVPSEAPTWLMSLIEGDETLAAALLAEARECDLADADDASERRHDEMRDMARSA